MTGSQRGQERSGEKVWEDAIYELNNIRYARQFHQVYEDALAGKLDKKGWIKGYTQLEYLACKDTLHVYNAIWVPTMQRKGLFTNAYHWWTDLPDTYEQWIALYTDPNGYPYDCYGTYYDEQIVPYRQQMKAYQESLKEWEQRNRR